MKKNFTEHCNRCNDYLQSTLIELDYLDPVQKVIHEQVDDSNVDTSE